MKRMSGNGSGCGARGRVAEDEGDSEKANDAESVEEADSEVGLDVAEATELLVINGIVWQRMECLSWMECSYPFLG